MTFAVRSLSARARMTVRGASEAQNRPNGQNIEKHSISLAKLDSRFAPPAFTIKGTCMHMERLRERAKFHLIGTPVESPLRWLRSLGEVLDRRRTPEWNSVRDEGRQIEKLLAQVIRPESNCIDIGCHLGAVLNQMLHYAPQGQHMAFEPTPYKFEWLKQRYRNAEVRPEALSDHEGEAEFFYQSDHSGFSGLRSHGAPNWVTETFKVRCARLDDLVEQHRKIDFIKIDVEGAEPLVMRGAKRILRQSRPQILFECTLSGLELFDWTPPQIHQFLGMDLGHDIYKIDDWLNRRPPLDLDGFVRAMSHPAQAFNFFSSPR